MTNSGFNPQEYKSRQRRDWDAVSPGWERWWETLEAGARHISQRLLESAEIKPGDRVLDIATGIGEPALSAARRVGARGRVVATDQATGMLDIARRRAAREGLTNVAFLETDGELLGDLDSEFDAVLCRWGLMFFPDVKAALSRIHEVLVPGGRVAAAVWSDPERVPSISFAMRVIGEQVQAPPPPPDMPSPFALADRDALRRLFEQAGFREVSIEPVNVTFSLPSAEAYTAFTQDIAAPVVAMVEEQPADRQAEIWEMLTEAVRRFETEDGGIELENEALCVAGRR